MLVSALLCARTVHAEDQKFSGDVFPGAALTSSIKDTQLDVGLDIKWNNIVTEIPDVATAAEPYQELGIRPFFRVPVESKDATNALIDRHLSALRIGLKGTYSWDPAATPRPDVSVSNWVAAAFEYGYGRFEYVPNGDEGQKTRDGHHSTAFEVTYARGMFLKSGFQWFPQARVRYDRGWKASDKVGVVMPGTAPAPSTTTDLVLTPPSVKPEASLRLAVPFTTGSELGLAPSVKYTLTGADRDALPGAKATRVRFEWFWYWFPGTLKGGGRIGLSPFVDVRTSGADDLKRVEYGGLIDLRLGTNLLEY